jgi:hypothetical protein
MSLTPIPMRRATSACDSSCASTEAKNRIATPAPTAAYATGGQPGKRDGRSPAPSVSVMSRAMISHVGCSAILMPAIVPIGNEPLPMLGV